MRLSLAEKLRCPDCHSHHPLSLRVEAQEGERVIQGELNCPSCGKSYPIQDRIPILLPSFQQEGDRDPDRSAEIARKQNQINYFNSVGTSELEINRPHGLGRVYKYLLDTKFDSVVQQYGDSLDGTTVLVSCCGSGMDAEYLTRSGSDVVGVDISLGALRGAQERAKRFDLEYDLVVGDAEALPFHDRSFGLSFVHDGLHHLQAPQKGFVEMSRVSYDALMVTEPVRAFATSIAVQLGIADSVEESGNRVYRFTQAEFQDYCHLAGLKPPKMKRYAMHYKQEPLSYFRYFESPRAFVSFTLLFRLLNLAIGRFGNKLALVAKH